MKDRAAEIILAVCSSRDLKTFSPPLDDSELRLAKEIKEDREKAKKEGRKIIFELPFDP